jgi:hypothetical protein
MREQGFPAGTRVGAQARAWDEAEVEAWLESRRITAPTRSGEVSAYRPTPGQGVGPETSIGASRYSYPNFRLAPFQDRIGLR